VSSESTFFPPYRRIALELRGEIEAGRYRVGQLIPTQQALVRRFQTSRATVQRALDVLRQDGYINSQQGRGSVVLDRNEMLRSQGAPPDLTSHVARAFRADRVTLDVFSLTTETLNWALTPTLNLIRDGELCPQHIAVRVLVPSPDLELPVHRRVDDAQDTRPLKRFQRLLRSSVVALKSSLESLSSDLGLVPEVSVEVRTVAIAPMQKLYVLNGTDVLTGFYRVVQRSVLVEGERMDIFDALGAKVSFFHHSTADGDASQGAQYVRQCLVFYDSLWSTVATPWELSE
jgi:DNA-binding transcriptional regulator YhcF (GntR family)